MSAVTAGRRPLRGTRVRCTFTSGRGTETVVGRVTAHYPDGIDVTVTLATTCHDVGDEFTVFDSERNAGTTIVEVVG